MIQKSAYTTAAATVAFSIFTPSSVFRRSPTSAQAVKATLQSPSTRILDHSATFLVFQSPRP